MKPSAIIVVIAALTLLPAVGTPLMPLAAREARAADSGFPANSILGEWWTENKDGRIRFVKQDDGTYRGWVSWGAHPRKDQFNKDLKSRARSIVGSLLIWGLAYNDEKYHDGYIYNPEDGDTYRVKAWLTSPNSLKLRGYLGISLLGQTQTWTRYR